MSKTLALVLVLICLASLIMLQPAAVSAQISSNGSTSAPAIQWQQNYGNTVEYASNLIQTSDGGYAFMDLGWTFSDSFSPATVYKVDSLGNVQWNKTINFFTSSAILQTSDDGYEISGYWHYASGPATYLIETATLIKMDSEGNIQWVKNYTSEPELGVLSSRIQTSDRGFVYWSSALAGGSIIKTDSSNNTQWIMNLTYHTFDAIPTYTYPLTLSSVIETSNGALAALGVGYNLLSNQQSGKIYLIKTEAFLPLPSPTQLTTPIPAPTVPELPRLAILSLFVSILLIAVMVNKAKKRKFKELNLINAEADIYG